MEFGLPRSVLGTRPTQARPSAAWTSISLMLISAYLFLPGCLTRSATPSLPYVAPAQAVPHVDPAAVQMAARMQDLETEVQRLRDQIERVQASGGNQSEIRNLHERVAAIERQLGIESPGSARGARQSGDLQEPPAARQTRDARQVERKPPRPFAAEHEAAPIEIVDQPVTPEEKDFKDAYLALRRQSPEEAFQLFEQFLKKYPKNSLRSDAVYWMGEARFAQGRFDESVLQFDRVIKEFPGSKKELDALLKQGYAFEKMGDPQSAQIIFRKLTKEHPHTAQARNAASKLKASATRP
jgi:tol-pal system protein YbgF